MGGLEKHFCAHKFVAMTLLSIILPISLLVSFRVSGIIPEPPTPETTTVEAVTWNMTRPENVDIITIDKWTRNSYTDNIVFMELSVQFAGYWENKPGWWPSDGDDDVVYLSIVATANVSEGFVYAMAVRFSRPDVFAKVYVEMHPASMTLQNLEIKGIREKGTNNRGAYFEAAAVNQPKNTSLSIIAYWVFLDRNDADHWLTVNLEVTYFSGTSYRKVIMPINLGVLAG